MAYDMPKVLLNAHHNHNLPSYDGFADPVKAYNTANHQLLIGNLRCYSAPPKFTTAIETIYCNNTCILKIENKVTETPQSVEVRQGDNMAPVLFLSLMIAFLETLKIVWKQQEIPVQRIMTTTSDNLTDGRICSHTPSMFRSNKLSAYKILQCLYLNDGAFLFGSQDDLQQGMELIYHHIA
jgi:hypothetical protein